MILFYENVMSSCKITYDIFQSWVTPLIHAQHPTKPMQLQIQVSAAGSLGHEFLLTTIDSMYHGRIWHASADNISPRKAKLSSHLLTHKRHPISHAYGRAVGCLFKSLENHDGKSTGNALCLSNGYILKLSAQYSLYFKVDFSLKKVFAFRYKSSWNLLIYC